MNALKLVSAVDAKEHFPELVIGFLEANLDCPPFTYPNSLKNMTRSFKTSAQRNNISVDLTVKITRNIPLEKLILKNPAGRLINRRNTVATGTPKGRPTLKSITNIPIGARGRKRKTISLAYIGLQPNPDARNLVRPADNSAVDIQTPRRRTYRSMSTPQLIPVPEDEPASVEAATAEPDLRVSPVNEAETTFDFDLFDSSIVGNLHYSSSE